LHLEATQFAAFVLVVLAAIPERTVQYVCLQDKKKITNSKKNVLFIMS